MGNCDICAQHLAMRQITFPDGVIYFVCDGCTPTGPDLHRVEFIHDDRFDLEAMFA